MNVPFLEKSEISWIISPESGRTRKISDAWWPDTRCESILQSLLQSLPILNSEPLTMMGSSEIYSVKFDIGIKWAQGVGS